MTFLSALTAMKEDRKMLVDAFDILGGAYGSFFMVLPRLLRTLARNSNSVVERTGPGIKGKPLFAKTLTGRLSGKLNPCQWLVRRPQHALQCEANEVLVALLDDLHDALSSIKARIGSTKLHPSMSSAFQVVESALKTEELRSVSRVPITRVQLETAARDRNGIYKSVSGLLQRRRRLLTSVISQDWSLAIDLLRAGWNEPVSDDDVFELYTLVSLLDILEYNCVLGPPVTYGLNMAKRAYVAEYQSRAGIAVRVYFQQSPVTALRAGSRYLDVLNSYTNFSARPRRPDIMVRVEGPAGTAVLLFECKNSDETGYIGDGVYKVMGYLADFAGNLEASRELRGVLCVPGAISRKLGARSDDILIASFDDRLPVANLIMNAIRSSSMGV